MRNVRHLVLALSVVLGAACGHESPTPPIAGVSIPTDGGFVSRSITINGVSHAYQIFVPRGYDATKRWPMILYLHSSGEGGSDGVMPTRVGLGPVVRAQSSTFPAIVLFPQMPSGEGLGLLRDSIAKGVRDLALQEFNVDPARVYLSGISAGSVLAYDLAYQEPTRYAGLVPVAMTICVICITGDRASDPAAAYAVAARRLKSLPIWAFHGTQDALFPVTNARLIVKAFQDAGSPIKYDEIQGPHDIWDRAYATPGLFTWLFAQRQGP